jgi:hypothetical protein
MQLLCNSEYDHFFLAGLADFDYFGFGKSRAPPIFTI